MAVICYAYTVSRSSTAIETPRYKQDLSVFRVLRPVLPLDIRQAVSSVKRIVFMLALEPEIHNVWLRFARKAITEI